ncbi:MAG: hypothetical protein KF734_06780 [Saprospiraceae bacterium]|nr:hypothetical protein [Saprospiraceae bacterium]
MESTNRGNSVRRRCSQRLSNSIRARLICAEEMESMAFRVAASSGVLGLLQAASDKRPTPIHKGNFDEQVKSGSRNMAQKYGGHWHISRI